MSQNLNTPVILNEILLNSDKNTLYNSLTVSKQWNEILNKEFFWKQYYKRNFSKDQSLNKLSKQMPNHTFKNMCKYKMANKRQLLSNIQEKENFQITDLSKLDIISDDEISIKQDCMIWFDKEKLILNYVEFNEPDNVRQFHVGSKIIMVDIIENLIVCINEDSVIILFSRDKRHEKWHLRLVNEPENDNGELIIINSCVLDNLITLSFYESIDRQGQQVNMEQDENVEQGENIEQDENVEQGENIEQGENMEENEEQEVNMEQEDVEQENNNEGEFKLIIWDLSLLIEALNENNSIENNLYDVKMGNAIIPISFNSIIVHNCAIQKYNEKYDINEKEFYVLSSNANDGIITVFIFADYLRIKETRNFMYSLEDDVLLWASIHADGTILAIGRKEIEIFNINDTELSQHKKIPANIFDNFNLYDVIFTPELLYILMFTQPPEEEEDNGEVRFAVIDISNNQENNEINENERLNTICTRWSDKDVCFNKFVDTGIVTFNPDTKHIIFTPFSKCFCKI